MFRLYITAFDVWFLQLPIIGLVGETLIAQQRTKTED